MKTIIIIIITLVFTDISIGQSIKFTYDDAGNRISRTIIYPVKQLALQGLYNNSNPEEEVNLKRENDAPEVLIKVYPNPVTNHFTLAIENPVINEPVMIYLMDVNGNLLYEEAFDDNINIIDTQGLAPGIYLLRVIYGEITENFRIIKQ